MSDKECKCRDEIQIGPPIDSHGARVCVRHSEDHQVSVGFVRPVKDGQPLTGAELIALDHIEDNRFSVTTVHKGRPARVTTPAFRTGWDRIFSKTQEVGQA